MQYKDDRIAREEDKTTENDICVWHQLNLYTQQNTRFHVYKFNCFVYIKFSFYGLSKKH